MTTPVKRTMMAQQALETSDLLNLRFASRVVGHTVKRKLMVDAPDGPSSDGGKKVRQSIVLAPVNDADAGTIMVGWLDIAQKRAELRLYEVVKSQYEQRYHQPFDVDKAPYDALMRDVQSMLGVQDITVAIIQDTPPALTESARATLANVPPPASSSGNVVAVVMAIGAILLIGLALVAYFLLRRDG